VEAGSDTARQLAITAFFVVHEHHGAILDLLMENRLGPALALLRPCFEALACGLWLLRGASAEQVERYVDGRITLKIEAMLKSLKRGPDANEDAFLAETWDLSEKSLHQYTHCSYQLLVRRFPDELTDDPVTPSEIADVIRFASATAMLATFELARIGRDLELSRTALRALALLYPDAADGRSQP
jgi:hypothetical protein